MGDETNLPSISAMFIPNTYVYMKNFKNSFSV